MSLQTKYRPRKFDDVLGQSEVVKSLKSVIKRNSSDCFLLSGPSGCGKTTLARICAIKLGCAPRDIIEVDAATNTGIDNMRQVQDGLVHLPFGGSAKVVILDECHMLSKQAWNSLLKAMEDAPAHAYWFLCTTEPGKVLPTVKTRCTSYTLKSVSDDKLTELIEYILEQEEHELDDNIISVIVNEAHGSPRQAIQNLNVCWTSKNRKEASAALKAAADSKEVIDLCRHLAKGQGSWKAVMAIVDKLKDTNPESVRIQVVNYFAVVLKSAKSDEEAIKHLQVLEAFSEPFNSSEKQAPLILAIGRVMFGE